MLRVLAPLLFGAVQLMQLAAAATIKPIAQFDDCALPEWPLPSLMDEHTYQNCLMREGGWGVKQAPCGIVRCQECFST